ncbi:MFS transporter [Aspergillus terreus]|uniref:MFS transporter n=1 Tax=Aspergillus terreus TaxID=33178 RepID=A0A5M3Z3M8_ASPTE|nr:hypothetical protein ATETN484_0009001400 [Aspergillus terreus]GFF17465.1 MFS transporter [Aspergillus terreus]
MLIPDLLQDQRWRFSSAFILFTAVLALFTQSFLYNFIVPILSYMLEIRLRLPPPQTQRYTTAVLTVYGAFSTLSAPVVAHFTDKTPDRRTPLLRSFAGCIVGTTLLALTPSVWALFLGCVIQAVSSSAGWIIAYTTLTDNVEKEHLGKALGLAMSFVAAGTISGPVVSGALLKLAGYWAAWAVPLVVLLINMVARFVTLEAHHDAPVQHPLGSDEEQAALLALRHSYPGTEPPDRFYGVVLRDIRVAVGLLNTLMFSMILTGFDSTLPLHLRRIFGWDSLPTGMIFLGLEVPGLLLGPLVGWLRDRVGLQYPTTLGWVLVAMLLSLLGVPGQEGFGWAGPETAGKAIFIAGTVGIGAAMSLVRGVAMLQVMAVVDDLQLRNMAVFGANGGYSKVVSLEQVAFSLGTIVGPLLAGSLSEVLGFYYMTYILAVISLGVGLTSFSFLVHKCPARTTAEN